MGEAMAPMASTAWLLSEAARRVQARAAMVYYGNDVFATLKPGQHLDQVRVWTARDMTEKFNDAFKALDGALDLTHGSGARLLVIVSDGEYTFTETNAAKAAIAECERTGVGVLWISTGWGPRAITAGTAAQVTPLKTDVVELADSIGRAAAAALASAC